MSNIGGSLGVPFQEDRLCSMYGVVSWMSVVSWKMMENMMENMSRLTELGVMLHHDLHLGQPVYRWSNVYTSKWAMLMTIGVW
jgi:hypothetical protein